MCNLYSQTKGQQAIRELVRAMRDLTGNLPAQPEIYPDQQAAIVRTGEDGARELVMARWGLPTPPQHMKTQRDPGVTNVRNTGSPHWRGWLGPENRCLVPLTAFAEPIGGRESAWFAVESAELAFFAGLHVPGWSSLRKVKDGPTTDDLYGFLTTAPNAEVAAVHPRAMPVILIEPDEIEAWMTVPWAEAQALQRPLPDGALARVEAP